MVESLTSPPGTRSEQSLADIAAGARRRLVDLSATRPVHLGASLSVIDILVAVYDALGLDPARPRRPERGDVILSKGHAVWGLYSVLAGFGVEGLDDPRAGHPLDTTPGVAAGTGALGHGLSIGAGLALAARLDGGDRKAVVVLGDGELDEGSVWEAAMFAAHHALANLVAVVDRNGLQQEGPTESVLALEPLAAKWQAFGWQVIEADGHDGAALRRTLEEAFASEDLPTVVIAHTVKGRGVPFMEHDPAFHHAHLTSHQHAAALTALAAGPEQEPA
ncbi:transketolase [Catenulispora sp. NF23]|uniref:transketolase n=1 Tax=Catenulispora pinistramenti TaxID=2705254 RepID=UPI001BA70D1E|nr:transketolase [Catenulispora pinistramenti]MBS2533097.1 transketolase [Catenulispora pinistramenti]